MSVTVEDILALPSMRGAKVLGGHGGLSRTVSSISVLESTDPGVLIEELFNNPASPDDFFNSELVITGFVNIKNNSKLQCANIRRLAEGGEVGLILYYVGVYVPAVDKSLIAVANELDFVLICMPENRPDLRYSEVMGEVWEAIIRDRMEDVSLLPEILERVSRLSPHQRSMETVLKMLSDRIRASVVLTDAGFHILNEAVWPRTLIHSFGENLSLSELPAVGDGPVSYSGLSGCLMYRSEILGESGQKMNLLLFKEGGLLSPEILRQALEVCRLSLNLFSQSHDEVAVRELVRAILQDEPLKMRRLSDIFHIDVASIHTMWILSGEGIAQTPSLPDNIRGLLSTRCKTAFGDVYGGSLVLFLDGPESLSEANQLASEILALPECRETSLVMCTDLSTTGEVQAAYITVRDSAADMLRLFPSRRVFHYQEAEFTRDCRIQIDSGLEAVSKATRALSSLTNDGEGPDLITTLSIYLLDGDSSVTRTAELMYLHKNTIKYRLQKTADILGYKPDKSPEYFSLYTALAIKRLIG